MPTKDRRQREKEDRAQTILDAAEAVMTANGLLGLSMDLVAQEAHLAKGTLYLYFASKDELLAALTLKARLLLLLDTFQTAVSQHESPIDQLKAIVRTNYTFYRQYSLYQELVSLSEVNNNRPESPELQLLKPGGKALIADFVPTHDYAIAIAFAEAGLTVESSKTYLTRVFVPMWMVVAGKKNSS